MKYYIGVDIGHGETAVTCYNVNTNTQVHIKLVHECSWTNAIYSAFYTDSDGNTRLVGKNEASVLAAQNASFRQNFKKKVSEMSENDRESMKTFVKALYNAIINNPTVKLTAGDDISFCIACPTEWSLEEAYDYLGLINEAGMTPKWVVSEAWAAYSKLQKKLQGQIPSAQRILVIDYGSSTIDYCAVDLTRDNKIVLQSSIPLGAHSVEKSVINDSDAGVLTYAIQIKQEYKTDVNMSLLHFASRRAKEEFFRKIKESFSLNKVPNDPYLLSVSRKHFSSPPADLEDKPFKWYADESEHDQYLTSIKEYQDYIREFKEFIVKLQKGLSENYLYSPDVIFLSGSASQMDFVKKIIKETFGTKVVLDDNPEYVVCDGIIEIAKSGDLRETLEYYPYVQLEQQYIDTPILEEFLLNLENKPIPLSHEKHALGLCYLLGIGCKMSPNKAFLQFSDDSDFSILMRAWMYMTGIGVVCDLDRARSQLDLIHSEHKGYQTLSKTLKDNVPSDDLYKIDYIRNFCDDSLEYGIESFVSSLIITSKYYNPYLYDRL